VSNPYRDKLLSISIAPSATLSRARNYYDSDALAGIFPNDAEDQIRDETGGYSPTEIAAMSDSEKNAWLHSRDEVIEDG
jgi:hypothetical protein